MKEDPEYYLKYRKAVEREMNGGFMGYHKGTPESQGALKVSVDSFIGMVHSIDTRVPVRPQGNDYQTAGK